MTDKEKILKLLEEGTITVEEASSLLNKLEYDADKKVDTVKKESGSKLKGKKLRINIKEGKSNKTINIAVPLSVATWALKHSKGNINIDGQQLDVEELRDIIENGCIGDITEIASSSGDTLTITVE